MENKITIIDGLSDTTSIKGILQSNKDLVIKLNDQNNVKHYGADLIAEQGDSLNVIVIGKKELDSTAEQLTALGSKLSVLPEFNETQSLVIGSPEDVLRFFQTSGNSISERGVKRIILDNVPAEDVEIARSILAIICKKPASPQVLILTGKAVDIATEIGQGYLQNKSDVKHFYYETGLELFDKPDALGSFIEAESLPKTLVFCNMPSDADLVEAMLRKRGIASRKLIGNVPSFKVKQSIEMIDSRTLTAIVATDVAGQYIDPGHFEVVINYSIHSDPEVYVQRTNSDTSNSLKKVINLVGPLDKTHFHYLKKVVESEITQIELPDVSGKAQIRLTALTNSANRNEKTISEKAKEMAEQVLLSDKKDLLLSYLVHSYLTYGMTAELSEMVAGSSNDEERSENGRGRFSRNEDRFGRRGNRDSSDASEAGDGNKSERRNTRYNSAPVKKTSRIYIGRGLDDGLTEGALREFLEKDLNGTACERISIRAQYAFIDFEDKDAQTFLTTFKDSPLAGSKSVQPAITINHARKERDDDDNAQSEESSSNDSAGADEADSFEDAAEA